MDAATLGVLIGGFVLGAGSIGRAPTAPLGVMEPYLGHESFRRMRVWVWIKFLVLFVPLAIFFPEAGPDYPLGDNGARFTYGAVEGISLSRCNAVRKAVRSPPNGLRGFWPRN